jgi:hypothetical protein
MQNDFQLISRALETPRVPPPMVEKASEQMNLFT